MLRQCNSRATLGKDTLQNNPFEGDSTFSSFDTSASTSESAPHESDVTLASKVSVVAANTLSTDPSEACSDASSSSHDPATFSSVCTVAKVPYFHYLRLYDFCSAHIDRFSVFFFLLVSNPTIYSSTHHFPGKSVSSGGTLISGLHLQTLALVHRQAAVLKRTWAFVVKSFNFF